MPQDVLPAQRKQVNGLVVSADWRERPADWPATRYEAKACKAGRAPAFLRFERRPRK